MHSAEHWRILADDTALAINNILILKGYIESADFVKPRCGGVEECNRETSPFFNSFKELLMTRLVEYGMPVLVEEAKDGLVVEYDIQMIYHLKKKALVERFHPHPVLLPSREKGRTEAIGGFIAVWRLEVLQWLMGRFVLHRQHTGGGFLGYF